MPNLILNLCIDVESSGLEVSWKGKSGSGAPTTFYYLVYRTQEDTPEPQEDDKVTLDGTNPARLLVFDGEPTGGPPAGWYLAPTFIDDRMIVSLDGSGSITSAGEYNPWPPT
ncbi:MAG: hypothetical protein IRZ16_14040 [Myxococcaceae bacterium]|nr:hypothetical protein [Myxococcaceae bacterium]